MFLTFIIHLCVLSEYRILSLFFFGFQLLSFAIILLFSLVDLFLTN